jgi:hypothetical protein
LGGELSFTAITFLGLMIGAGTGNTSIEELITNFLSNLVEAILGICNEFVAYLNFRVWHNHGSKHRAVFIIPVVIFMNNEVRVIVPWHHMVVDAKQPAVSMQPINITAQCCVVRGQIDNGSIF